MQYRIAKIPKGNGKFRKIFIPSEEFSQTLRNKLDVLDAILMKVDFAKVNHAFLHHRNCVTNATQHIGYEYCLSLDIEDFFDSITEDHVKGIIDDELIKLVFVDQEMPFPANRILGQGLPTSPVVSNIAFAKVDNEIMQLVEMLNQDIVYTRYADDLVFSFNEIKFKDIIYKRVNKILKKNGFTLNLRKTKLQKATNGNIIITGLAVNKNGVFPTRKTKKKIRAAQHQVNENSLNGLRGWAMCKIPKIRHKENPKKSG